MAEHSSHPTHRSVTRLLVSDWAWRLFDEELNGREIDFPALGWRRIWIEELRPGLTVEVSEWHFGVDQPDSAPLPAPAWHRMAPAAAGDETPGLETSVRSRQVLAGWVHA